MNIADNMTDIFYKAIRDTEIYGVERAAGEPLEMPNYEFVLLDIEKNIVEAEGIDYGYLCAEELWYALAMEDIFFIKKFKAPGFERSSEDGLYSNSAYGHIVHKRYGFDQVEQVIDILSKKPHSRRAVINFNVPNRHRRTCLDEICTFNLSFYIIDNKLNCTCCMRSNDLLGCMPYDVAYFTSLQKYIAKRLKVGYGQYCHFAVSLHRYDKTNAETLINEKYKRIKDRIIFNYDLLTITADQLYSYCMEFNRIIKEEYYVNDLDAKENNKYIEKLFNEHNILIKCKAEKE